MINVLHLRDTDKVCGPGKTIIETCLRIDKSRFNLKIGLFLLESQRDNIYKKSAEDRGIEVLEIRTKSQYDFRVVSQIIKIVKEHNIHIVHSHEYKSDIIAFLVSRFIDIPIMTTAHGWIVNGLKARVYIGLGKRVLRYFDRVIAVSPKIQQELLRVKVSKEKCPLIFNAIVAENYQPEDYESNFLREKYKLPKGAFIFCNVGRLSREKGQKEFILAAKKIAEEYSNTYFFLVGDGADKSSLEKLVQDLNLTDRVFFTGHFHDVRPVFRDMDALALTSYTEGFPNVVLESISMNTPVLATDVGGTAEIVKNQETGLLIKPYDYMAVAGAMRFILNNPDKARQYVKKGKELLYERYEFNIRIQKIQNVYMDLVR